MKVGDGCKERCRDGAIDGVGREIKDDLEGVGGQTSAREKVTRKRTSQLIQVKVDE